MQHYQDPAGGIHCLSQEQIDADYESLLPNGSLKITEEEADALRPKPSNLELIEAKKQAIRQVRESILNRLAGIAFAAQLSGDTDTTDAYLVVREGLLDMTADLPTDPTLVDSEVMSRYAALVIQCTPEMVSAFAEIDQ